MQSVINPKLYRNLERCFKHVRVTNSSQHAPVIYRPDYVYREGRPKAEVVEWGETYYVNCPFCSDTRKRLAICHAWAERDEETEDDMLHLVICFNEGCLATREKQKELHALVYPHGKYGRSIAPPPKMVKSVRDEPQPIEFHLPQGKLLSKLPDHNPSVRYMRKRGFDPETLSELWGVRSCCENTRERPKFFRRRILIPIWRPITNPFAPGVTSEVELAGWQARAIDPEDDRPKYLTSRGTKKTEQLYGLMEAKRESGPVLVVEGVTDVWRYGPGAVALFGKTISAAQVTLLRRHLGRRQILVLLDSDAKDNAEAIRTKIVRCRREHEDYAAVRIGTLPTGRSDPGECTSAELHALVDEAFS
jgi:hypothetical protein